MRTDRGWRRFYATGWLVSAGITALAFRQWQAYVREVEERAEEAERTREEVARRRAGEERLRIARDLHDSLTHSISVIRLQAGVAVHLARKHGEEVPEALLAIQEASLDAMRELRSTLEVHRDAATTSRRTAAAWTASTPWSSGPRPPACPTTSARSRGATRDLPPEVDRAGVPDRAGGADQRRPARGQRDSRRAHRPSGPDCLTVRDRGQRPACSNTPPVPGLGLVGMRERVTALGGSLRTGPRPDGGFAVRADLPTRSDLVIRVLLVDDQALIRTGIRALLDAEDDIEVVAEEADGVRPSTGPGRSSPTSC